MSLTFTAARDEILTVFKTAWDAGADTAGKVVIYPDAKNQVPKTNDADSNPNLWARVSVIHDTGGQATLGGIGNRLFRREGSVTVQVFTPIGTGLSIADRVYKIVVDAFEGKTSASGNVWFRNVRVNEIGPEGSWFQTNIIIDFEYDERK